MNTKERLPLADRIEKVQAYSARDLGALVRVDGSEPSGDVRVFLVDEAQRALIVHALRTISD